MSSVRVALVVVALTAVACGTRQGEQQARSAALGDPLVVRCQAAGEDVPCLPLDGEFACSFVASKQPVLGDPATLRQVRVPTSTVDPIVAGTTTVSDGVGTFTVVVQDSLVSFDWTSTVGVDFVIGTSPRDTTPTGAWIYQYDPKATGDTALQAYQAGQIHDVLFCYRSEQPPPQALAVAKTASASLRRTWSWNVAKSSPTTSVTLAPGAKFDASYVVTVTAASVDAEWAVTGTITISNPSATAATNVAIADSYAGVAAAITCPAPFAGTLAAGETVTCTYSVAPGGAFDGTNVVTVTADQRPPASASAAVAFGAAQAIDVDGCVTVTDTHPGAAGSPVTSPLGSVCAAAAPARITYRLPIGPYATCDASGEGLTFANTATFVAPSGATGSSTWTVDVRVPCAAGCTLTQGYWKTHGKHGPAPFDDAWLLVGPKADDELFAISGLTYHQVLATAPRGSAWFILAHQYIAAKMNVLNGADPSAVAAELAWAEEFFAIHKPTTRYKPSLAPTMIATAETLDRYNNGLIGPGHCDGDKPPGHGEKPPDDGGGTCGGGGGGHDDGHHEDGRGRWKDDRDHDDRLSRGQHRR